MRAIRCVLMGLFLIVWPLIVAVVFAVSTLYYLIATGFYADEIPPYYAHYL